MKLISNGACACRRRYGLLPAGTLHLVRAAILLIGMAAPFFVHAKSNAQTITFSASNVTLPKLFTVFKQQTGYLFFYRKEDLVNIPSISVKLKNASLESAMETVTASLPLAFKIEGNTVFITRTAGKPAVKQVVAAIPVGLISGMVMNEQQKPLQGASVKIKGTLTGTSTDAEGRFSLEAGNGQTLLISYIGYIDREITLTGETSLMIRLSLDLQEMNKVVVVGYGTQSRKDLTGSISSVKPAATANTPISNVTQMLQGQAAGVSVTSNSGAPGAGLTVNIRGVNSFGDNQPLYVVDGIPLGEGFNLSAINTSDIESIDILKDASATAIYGTRASNGVVQITTKRGKSGRPVTSATASYGWQSLQNKVDVLDAHQFADYVRELYGAAAKPIDSLAAFVNTDWQDEVFNPSAVIQSYNLTTSGGNENTQFSIGGGYMNQEGIINTSLFKRYSARANVTTRAAKWLKLGANLNFSRSENNPIATDNIYTSPSILALQNQPTTRAGKISTGKWYGSTGGIFGDAFQPLAILNEEKRFSQQNMLFGNIFAEVTLLKGLIFNVNLSENFSYNSSYYWVPTYEAGVSGNFGTGRKAEATNYYSNTVFFSTLAYSRTMGAHNATLMLGTSAEKTFERYSSGSTDGFLHNQMQDLTRGNLASANRNVDGGTARGALASYFGRVNYSFQNKYLLTATLRRDGSYRFAPQNRWGTFPSASVGWVISEERFLKTVPAVTFLKLRTSYGLTGNQRIPPFLYVASIGGAVSWDRQYAFGPSTRDQNYTIVSPRVNGKSFNGIPNPSIKWEATKQFNLGFDLTLLNRITLNVDYYSKLTDGLLLNKPLPHTTGFTGAFVNLGQIMNSGLELNLNSTNLTGVVGWTTNFNISFNKNKVKKLVNKLPVTGSFSRSEEGQPIGQFYGYVVDGIFQSDAEAASYTYKNDDGTTSRTYPLAQAGDIRFKDLDGDNRITDKDRSFLGNPRPKFFYGFTNTVSWNNLELSVLLYGVHGNKIYNAMGIWLENMDGHGPYNQTARILDRWTTKNPGAAMPRAVMGDPNQNARAGTSRWVEDASYLRVKNITLSYRLPASFMGKLGLSTAQLYCNLNNWFTFTDYYGYDPEIGDLNGETLAAGVDAGNYPGAKSVMVGINVNF